MPCDRHDAELAGTGCVGHEAVHDLSPQRPPLQSPATKSLQWTPNTRVSQPISVLRQCLGHRVGTGHGQVVSRPEMREIREKSVWSREELVRGEQELLWPCGITCAQDHCLSQLERTSAVEELEGDTKENLACPCTPVFTEQLRLEGTSVGHLVQPPCFKQGHLEPVAQGHVQTSFEYLQAWRRHKLPGQAVLVLSSLTVKTCVLMFKQSLLCFSLLPLPLVLSLGATEKTLAPSSLHPLFRHFCTLMRSLRDLFSRVNCPSSLSRSA